MPLDESLPDPWTLPNPWAGIPLVGDLIAAIQEALEDLSAGGGGGPAGPSGIDGLDGSTGPAGPAGAAGATGTAGAAGADGRDGIDGLQGPPGPAGPSSYPIHQTAHGLALGNVVRIDGSGNYVLAQADSAANAEVAGIVSSVAGVDDFTLTVIGKVTGLTSLSAGSAYFLDPAVAGALTGTEPTTLGQVSKPILLALSATAGFFFNFRGEVLSAPQPGPQGLDGLDGSLGLPGVAGPQGVPGIDGLDGTPGPAGPAGMGTGFTRLVDITLSVDSSTIDTGANAIPAGYDVLTIWILAKTDDVIGGDGTDGGTLIPIYLTVNGDTAAHYDLDYLVYGGTGTFGHGTLRGQTSWEMTAHGSGGTGGYAAVNRLTIPNYDKNVFGKVAEVTTASPDGMSDLDSEVVIKSLGWRSTAAINQMTLTTGGANKLKAGSRLLIYGQTDALGGTGPQGIPGQDGIDGLQGPVGGTGPAGSAGPPGIDGIDGNAGATGPQGATGASGAGASGDGWIDDTAETWTFATSTTFTVPTDLTTKYPVGTYIKLTQTTVKYFVVSAVSVAAGTTTVTIQGGTDYTLANAAISANFHSYEVRPQGFPTWFNFTPGTITGFVTPTVNVARFAVIGRVCHLYVDITGTSNATNFHFTTPFAIIPSTLAASWSFATDNGAGLAGTGLVSNTGSTQIDVFKDSTGAAWTAANTKRAFVNFAYQI